MKRPGSRSAGTKLRTITSESRTPPDDRGSDAVAIPPNAARLNSISGQVIEEKSGLPLAGVTVKWVVDGAPAQRKRRARVELGSATTDTAGNFVISVNRNSEAQAALCGTGQGRSRRTYLFIADGKKKMVGRPFEVTASTREIVLHPPSRTKPSKQQWRALTNYLTTNRMMLVRDAAQQVSGPFADSPVNNWSVGTRASALRGMLEAIAAEEQKTADQVDLLYQNQFIQTAALGEGKLRRGVTQFINPENLGRFKFRPDKSLPWLRASDRELYRDYLRGVWVAAAQAMYYQNDFTTPAASIFERQLDERFEQDFHTGDDTAAPAATLLIPLLRAILMRDSGRGGFGLNAAAIPAQGTQSDDDYLATLIALSKVSARELRNRFRVSFERAPGETTSLLQLNIEALLGLLADTYQSPIEPFPAIPVVADNGRPLIFGPYIGRAPFFLEYEEWLERQGVFWPENIYDIRTSLPFFNADYRSDIDQQKAYTGAALYPGEGYFDDYAGERAKSGAWLEQLVPITDKIRDAFGKIDGQLYPDAIMALNDASAALEKLAQNYPANWIKDKFWWQWSWGAWNNKNVNDRHYSDVWVSLIDRAKIRVTTPKELTNFEEFFDPPYYPTWDGSIMVISDYDSEGAEKGMAKARSLYIYSVFYLYFVLLPYLRSQIDFAQGNFANAIHALSYLTGYRVGIGETASAPGYDTTMQPQNWPNLYRHQMLPYTTLVGFNQDTSEYADLAPILSEPWFDIKGSYQQLAIAPFEQRFFKLAQGEVMLALADQLYRNDDPSSIRRARELYKGVLFMHREDPDIAPHFASPAKLGVLPLPDPIFWRYTENPAKVSQTTRARQALFQIEQGLNVYGYRDDMVPVLRYKPLKQAADLFATSAKSAQNDYLDYMTRYEQALIDLWQTQSLVKKAEASAGIAQEHIAIAQAGVDKAQEQVAAVQAQIAAKQKEIADKSSLFEQFSDFFGGIKDSLTGMVPLAQKVMADDSAAGAVTGDQMLDILGKGASGGATGAKDAAIETLGSGAGLMIGFGAFAYTSYTSMQSMADAAAKRDGDLKTLETVALPAAQAQVRLKQRDVAIAQYESQIAQADLDFANTLLRFQQDRFLNADFWNKLTLFANRLMRRYVDLGARAAWQAERALAFEQNRQIRIIKLNYVPEALRGVTGADRLLADLAELEANRIQGVRLATPVKHTISLARNFPLAFGQLKKTGSCRWRTDEADLRQAYPGTFAYRVRAITAAVHNPDGEAPRGILRNGGISLVSNEDLTNNILARFADALALSEFRLQDDLFVYGLPGETLLQFEGSGFETVWELEFPVNANPRGLTAVADVLITFDCNAYYSDAVAAKQAAQGPAEVSRAIVLAASTVDPKGLASLKGAGPAKIVFDPAKIVLPAQETKREVSNLGLICVGTTTKKYNAKLTATKSAATATFQINNGIAMSNAGPLLGAAGPLPLNDLVGQDLNQPFALEINRAGVAAELSQLFDIVLYLEYTAKF